MKTLGGFLIAAVFFFIGWFFNYQGFEALAKAQDFLQTLGAFGLLIIGISLSFISGMLIRESLDFS